MLVVVWATLVTLLQARTNGSCRTPLSRLLCASGVLGGGSTWFFLLAFFVSRAIAAVRTNLTVLVRCCGCCSWVAGWLAWKLFPNLTSATPVLSEFRSNSGNFRRR